ncbi:MAG: DNA-3-methyladenine glycosylase [Gaiellaceae bacterium]|nr:DNA-3-methyladenine glycosylase [Gaiellaceae bacterium]MDX6472511.1 DNA-3-methyladenine glycosylase [Gaiellaceae bacterium]
MTVELAVTPRGPFSLPFSARLSSDATRTFRDGLFTQVLAVEDRIEVGRAWQIPDGTVTIVAESSAGAERMRWLLALDDDHSDFLRLVRDDPMLGTASRTLRGLRPVRVATVAQALLRAFCGQLIEAKVARRLEQTIIRRLCAPGADRLHVAPTTSDLAAVAPAQLRALGLHTRRAAALVRLCRSFELERLHEQPTEAIARRLERERGLGPWSVGVVCLEGLGRMDYGLVGDLGLVKLLRALRGRPVEGWETAELLEPYGEWAGLASVYLLAGFARGLLPVSEARAA